MQFWNQPKTGDWNGSGTKMVWITGHVIQWNCWVWLFELKTWSHSQVKLVLMLKLFFCKILAKCCIQDQGDLAQSFWSGWRPRDCKCRTHRQRSCNCTYLIFILGTQDVEEQVYIALIHSSHSFVHNNLSWGRGRREGERGDQEGREEVRRGVGKGGRPGRRGRRGWGGEAGDEEGREEREGEVRRGGREERRRARMGEVSGWCWYTDSVHYYHYSQLIVSTNSMPYHWHDESSGRDSPQTCVGLLE